MPDKHAFLSASGSARWINCPPSARACEDIPDKQTEFTMEGTDAHMLCEYKLRKYLGQNAEDPNKWTVHQKVQE